MKTLQSIGVLCIMTLLFAPPSSEAADFDAQLLAIQHEWAIANYELLADEDRREEAFEKLAAKVAAFVKDNPNRAEALVWQGIVLSTYAGAKGGLGALKLAKQSRAALDDAIQIDATVLDGSAYTSLGTLYFKVPGWPLGFGNDKKAREYLEKALELNPDGIDPNYFYGEFLIEEGKNKEAIEYLERALAAPERPDRPLADAGRREEVRKLLSKAGKKA